MKRSVSLIIAVVIVLSLGVTVFAAGITKNAGSTFTVTTGNNSWPWESTRVTVNLTGDNYSVQQHNKKLHGSVAFTVTLSNGQKVKLYNGGYFDLPGKKKTYKMSISGLASGIKKVQVTTSNGTVK